MNNYCYTCVVDEKKRTVISEVEVHETMAHFGIPVCPKHYGQITQERLAKRLAEMNKPGYLDQL